MFFSKDTPIFESEPDDAVIAKAESGALIDQLLRLLAVSKADAEEMRQKPEMLEQTESALFMVNGHMIDDIIIGFWGQPQDFCWSVKWYRYYKDERIGLPLLQTVVNQRATFRWVPMPDGAITLRPLELLVPEVQVYADEPISPDIKLAEPIITTRGIDRKTKQIVINQTYYGT